MQTGWTQRLLRIVSTPSCRAAASLRSAGDGVTGPAQRRGRCGRGCPAGGCHGCSQTVHAATVVLLFCSPVLDCGRQIRSDQIPAVPVGKRRSYLVVHGTPLLTYVRTGSGRCTSSGIVGLRYCICVHGKGRSVFSIDRS
jgi:hypothetical protein